MRVGSLLALLLLSSVGCAGEPEAATPTASPESPSTLPSQTPSSTPTASAPVGRWKVPGSGRVAAVGDVLLVQADDRVRAVRRSDGKELWRRQRAAPGAELESVRIAGGFVVLWTVTGRDPAVTGRVEVVDPATGKPVWTGRGVTAAVAHQDAVYLSGCRRPGAGCTISRREIRTGRTAWTIPAGLFTVSADAIGVAEPYAPPAARYVAAGVGNSDQPWAAVDTRTGRVLPGRAPEPGSHLVVAGTTLIGTGPDRPDCAVDLLAVDARTGAARRGVVYAGRTEQGECRLAALPTAAALPGAGSRLLAMTKQGRAQLFDVPTGRAVWTATEPGMPLDAGNGSVLIGQDGRLSVLDLATGAKRWTIPAAGRPGSRGAVLTGRLVVVDEVTGGRPYAAAYDAADGRLLRRYSGSVAGAGDGWLAVTGRTGTDLALFEL